MSGSNQFRAIATGGGANALTPAAYAALVTSTLGLGYSSGVANSTYINTTLRQSSFVVTAIAQAIADMTGAAVNDDGVIANFEGQFLGMLQQAPYCSGVAAGTADAITLALNPALTALTTGQTVIVRAGFANATTTPTFSPNGLAAKTIVKGAGSALAAGDIAGAGHWIELQYDLTLDKWVLQNPATGVSAATSPQILSIGASVASNALTITSAATKLDFRNATLTNGAPVSGLSVGALTIIVPNGATLGTVAAQPARLQVLVAYNAGTPVLCVCNGLTVDESSLISPTTISAGATTIGVIYSASAVAANSPFRLIGYVDITEAVAGTWATAPTVVQGQGGTLTPASLGVGQTWQDVTASRALGTTYYNTTGRPVLAVITITFGSGTSMTMSIGGVSITMDGSHASTERTTNTFVIPPGVSYSYSTSGGDTLFKWAEIR